MYDGLKIDDRRRKISPSIGIVMEILFVSRRQRLGFGG